jgi:hypothetical protein
LGLRRVRDDRRTSTARRCAATKPMHREKPKRSGK